jgi:shikimate dehydrogenase
MLVHQGARALEIWSGASVPVATMAAAARAAMGR